MLKRQQLIFVLTAISAMHLIVSVHPAHSQGQQSTLQGGLSQAQAQLQEQPEMPPPWPRQSQTAMPGQQPGSQLQSMLDNVESAPNFPPPPQQFNEQLRAPAPAQVQVQPSQPQLSPLQKTIQMLTGGSAQATPAPAREEKFGFGTVFKTFFGDGSPSDASGNANRAEEQAGYAHGACERSYYGNRDRRNEAADQAYYAAEAARREADAAYAKTQSGDPNAQTYADKARAYADQAQADADTARSNADSSW